ncbi:hypothetical protein pclt_cds_638 [Pandoravirus celtis]|uniref:Uncharacterized protein n=1 Tax=Pandoravirus celtis TaxID=2568002 RepID=A0A4D6EHE6_9VIRU|nr:hypothetical protein pclt_cds_638 [Pandoravirus celtis]
MLPRRCCAVNFVGRPPSFRVRWARNLTRFVTASPPRQKRKSRWFVPDKDSQMQAARQTAARNLPQETVGWDAVRQWAVDSGLDSPEALRQWIDEMAPRGLYRGIDPRAAALLQTLQQFSMASSSGQPTLEIQALPSAYDRLLEVLSKPNVGSRYNRDKDGYDYPPTMGGPEWIRPLVDPLAEGGRLWPPSPVTVLVRMNEIASRALGYGPVDSDAMILDLTTKDYAGDGFATAERVADMLSNFGKRVAKMEPGKYGARIDPTAPKLASDVDIAKARQRWPVVAPTGEIQRPYILAISSVVPWRPDGQTTAADLVRAVLISQGGSLIRRLLVSDTTGAIIDGDDGGVFKEDIWETDPETYARRINERRIRQASGNNPSLVVDIMMPLVQAVRDGRADAMGMVPISLGDQYGFRRSHGVRRTSAPYMVRAFEPAEVLGALLAARRAAAAAAINKATASVGGLANLAARAYRGAIATANAPIDARQLAAAQAVALMCAASDTPQDRECALAGARVLGVSLDKLAAAQAVARACATNDTLRDRALEGARVLGVSPEVLQSGDLTALCEASAEAVRRLYGDA